MSHQQLPHEHGSTATITVGRLATTTAGSTIVYRGPLQRSRLRLLLRAMDKAYGDVHLVWLVPAPPADLRRRRFTGFRDFLPRAVRHASILAAPRSRLPVVIRRLRAQLDPSGPSMLLGVPLVLVRGHGSPQIWVLNGVPEERVLHHPGWTGRLGAHAEWWSDRLGHEPDLVVVISERMKDMVIERCGFTNVAVVPTTVNRSLFASGSPEDDGQRRHLAYLGTGAPWQGLDVLAEVWASLATEDSGAEFLAISRDERTDVLGRALPPGRFTRVGTEEPAEVASLLRTCKLGFLVREPHVVNAAAFPTKFGEYVACGVPVVASDVGWDVSGVLEDTEAGVLVGPDSPPADVARASRSVLERPREELASACERAAEHLDESRWATRLSERLRASAPPPSG